MRAVWEGSLVVDRSGDVEVVTSAPVTAVDTTGAGDAFVGALVARLADGWSLVQSARCASRVGAYVCTRPGAQDSYPRRKDELPEPA